MQLDHAKGLGNVLYVYGAFYIYDHLPLVIRDRPTCRSQTGSQTLFNCKFAGAAWSRA